MVLNIGGVDVERNLTFLPTCVLLQNICKPLCIFVVLSFHAMFLGVDFTRMKSYENKPILLNFFMHWPQNIKNNWKLEFY
jgi:hypothetical protein